MRTEQAALSIDLGNQAVDTGCMVDVLAIITLEESAQHRRMELTSKPAMAAKVSALSIVEQSADAIAMTLVVEIECLVGECANHPVEEVVIGLDALVAIFLELRDETIGIPRTTNHVKVEDVEERIGHRSIALTRHSRACVRATGIDPLLLLYPLRKRKHSIEIGDKAILIDIDGNIALLVLQHLEEIAIGCLIGQTHTRIACLLVEGAAEQVELLVEGTTVEFDSWLMGHLWGLLD